MTTRQLSAASLVHIVMGLSLVIIPSLMGTEAVLLTSKIINLVDGLSFGISGHKIKLTLQLRKELSEMLFGVKNRDGQLVGLYVYQNEPHSITSLAALETRLEATYLTTRKKLEATGQETVLALEGEHTRAKSQLAQLLEQAKRDFDIRVDKFMSYAAGLKQPIFILIQESCEKRDKKDSFILTWAEAPEGEDHKIFHERIKTFTLLQELITDISDFLTDLVHSCPKARVQFKELMRKDIEDKKQANEHH